MVPTPSYNCSLTLAIGTELVAGPASAMVIFTLMSASRTPGMSHAANQVRQGSSSIIQAVTWELHTNRLVRTRPALILWFSNTLKPSSSSLRKSGQEPHLTLQVPRPSATLPAIQICSVAMHVGGLDNIRSLVATRERVKARYISQANTARLTSRALWKVGQRG